MIYNIKKNGMRSVISFLVLFLAILASPLPVLAEMTVTKYSPGLAAGFRGITFDGTNLWVGKPSNNFGTPVIPGTLTKISTNGVIQNSYSTEGNGLIFDGTNLWTSANIYSSSGFSKIYKTSLGGSTNSYSVPLVPVSTFQGGSKSIIGIVSNGADIYYGIVSPYNMGFPFSGLYLGKFSISSGVSSVTPELFLIGTAEKALDALGNLWVSGLWGSYHKYSPSSHSLSSYSIYTTPEFSYLSNMIFDGTNMWTFDRSYIVKILPDGSSLKFPFPAGTIPSMGSMVFDGVNMYVSDNSIAGIIKVSPSGVMTSYSSTLINITDMVFDGSNIWATYVGSIYDFTNPPTSTSIAKISFGGTISVSSNLAGASWTINEPQTITGSGATQTSTSQPAGTYTITWNTVAGYTTPISQSLTLTVGNTILFEGNYIATGCANNTNASGVRLTQMMSGKNTVGQDRKAEPSSKIKSVFGTDSYCFGNSDTTKTYFVPQGSAAEFKSLWDNIESGSNPLPGLYKIQ